MKKIKHFYPLIAVFAFTGLYAQVGINTPTPQSTLDVVGNAASTSSKDGVTAPRLTRQQLAAKAAGTYATAQIGTLVFVTDATTPTGTTPSLAQTANISKIGYHYFDGITWKQLTDTDTVTNSVNIYNSDGTLSSNRVVTQGANTLAFTSTAVNGFSVDDSTLSVDAANDRVGLGTTIPRSRFEIVSDNVGSGAGNDFNFTGYGTSKNPALFLASASGTAAAPTNLLVNDIIGALYFTPRVSGAFPTGSSIVSNYRGDGTTNLTDLVFTTSNAERVRIDPAGNVGIATTTPKQQLHIVGSGATSGITSSFLSGIAITGTGAASGFTGPGFYLENASAAAGSRLFKINYTLNATEPILNFQAVSDDASTSASQVLALTRSGKLGINATSAPTNNLTVNGNASIGNGYIGNAAPANGAIIQGNVGIGSAVPNRKLHVEGSGYFNGAVTTATTKDAIDINIGQDGFAYGNRTDNFGINIRSSSTVGTGAVARINFGDTNTTTAGTGKYLSFSVGNGLNELMYLTDNNSGRVGIGTTTPGAKLSVSSSVTGPVLSLQNTSITGNPTLNIYPGYTSNGATISPGNQYAVVFDQDPGVTTGTNRALYDFHGEVRAVSTSTLSDIRLKKDIINLNEYGLREIMKIQPRRYHFKEYDTPDIGVIAQELKAVVPELVNGNENEGLLSVDYSKLSLILINGMKEQQAEIKEQKKEIDLLKQQVKELIELNKNKQ